VLGVGTFIVVVDDRVELDRVQVLAQLVMQLAGEMFALRFQCAQVLPGQLAVVGKRLREPLFKRA